MFRTASKYAGLFFISLTASQVAVAFEQDDWLQQPERFQNSFQCINTDVKTGTQTFRYVIVEYPSEGLLPCSVDYEKPTENKPAQTLWRSANTAGYCEDKAAGLADKLAGFGWDCRTPEGQTPLSAQLEEKPASAAPVSPWQVAKEKSALDFVGPVINLELASNTPQQGQTYDLTAIVTDNVGVSNVHLFYQTGNSPYVSLLMRHAEESDRYVATLSEEETVKGSIKYYIMAEDSSGNTVLHGNSISPRALEFVAEKSASDPLPADAAVFVTKTSSFVRDKTDAEQVLWQKAELGHKAADYQHYLDTYPFGRYVSMAEARLNFLSEQGDDSVVKTIRKPEPLW